MLDLGSRMDLEHAAKRSDRRHRVGFKVAVTVEREPVHPSAWPESAPGAARTALILYLMPARRFARLRVPVT
jgi:hypothetical protein